MAGGRVERGSRREKAAAASAVVPFPRSEPGDRLDLARLVPSGRSLALSFVVVVAVLAALWGARASSVFAVDTIVVQGAPPAVAREVEAVAGAELGESLLSVSAGDVEARVRALPSVAGASVDRAFPHTLVVKVAPEKAVAVARRGEASWLVTGAGKVVREIETGTERRYPRLWLPKRTPVPQVGRSLPASYIPAARALQVVQEVGVRRVKAVRSTEAELTLVPVRGPEVRLGDATDIGLKLAVAARVLPLVADGTVYLDVSVPERPVASRYLNP